MRAAARTGLVAALTLLSFQCHAQSAEVQLQTAIVTDGRACPKVVTYKTLGKTTGGAALLAVVCSDGGHHVIEMGQDLSLKYLLSCSTFEAAANRSCF